MAAFIHTIRLSGVMCPSHVSASLVGKILEHNCHLYVCPLRNVRRSYNQKYSPTTCILLTKNKNSFELLSAADNCPPFIWVRCEMSRNVCSDKTSFLFFLQTRKTEKLFGKKNFSAV